MTTDNTHVLPTDPVVLEALKKGVQEMVDSMTRILSERTLIKESVIALKEKTQVDKKVIRQLAKTHFKDEMRKKMAETNDLAALYQTVFKVNLDDEDED
jgi:regulator of replication initiation timing